MIGSRLRFPIASLKERLWAQPLGYAVLTWDAARPEDGASDPQFDRIHVPPLLAEDLFEDAFVLDQKPAGELLRDAPVLQTGGQPQRAEV